MGTVSFFGCLLGDAFDQRGDGLAINLQSYLHGLIVKPARAADLLGRLKHGVELFPGVMAVDKLLDGHVGTETGGQNLPPQRIKRVGGGGADLGAVRFVIAEHSRGRKEDEEDRRRKAHSISPLSGYLKSRIALPVQTGFVACR